MNDICIITKKNIIVITTFYISVFLYLSFSMFYDIRCYDGINLKFVCHYFYSYNHDLSFSLSLSLSSTLSLSRTLLLPPLSLMLSFLFNYFESLEYPVDSPWIVSAND
jgi:hypothetical protein